MADKVAVVTGATGGIGSALCKLLVQSGVKVILLDRNLTASQAFAKTLDQLESGCVKDALAVDLSDHGDIKRVTDDIVARFPAIDFLFNNAGVLTEKLQFSKYGNELHFEVNTLAPLQMIDLLRPALKQSGAAFIVNTSAGIALGEKQLVLADLVHPKTFSKLFGPYTKSKEALNVITAALAPELLKDNIIVRAADPGPTQSALTKGAGTPLWMRVFYFLLPTPNKSARHIYEAAVAKKLGRESGIFLTGGKAKPLPPTLSNAAFQSTFLAQCRRIIADGQLTASIGT